jgi:hypothetical protein
MNVTQFKSCYEEAFNNFTRVDEELLHFINNYVTAPNDPLGNLEKNRLVALESGKTEIASIWESVHSLISGYSTSPKNQKETMPTLTDDGLLQKTT